LQKERKAMRIRRRVAPQREQDTRRLVGIPCVPSTRRRKNVSGKE
jgi:hypothetical protein